MIQVINYRSVSNQFFSSGTNLSHFHFVSQFTSNCFLRFLDLKSPQTGSIPKFHFLVVNPQIDGFGCFSLNDDGVEACLFQFCSPEASSFGFSVCACEGRFGAYTVTSTATDGRASHGTTSKNQLVFWIKRVYSRLQFLEQVIGY